MKLSEILQEWANDCAINKTELDGESLNIPALHSKYTTMLTTERHHLRKLERRKKILRKDLQLYYSGKSDPEIYKENPLQIKVLKNDLPTHIEGDEDWNDLMAKIDLQEEKVLTLKDILSNINNRNWQIKNAIDWQKFISGIG